MAGDAEAPRMSQAMPVRENEAGIAPELSQCRRDDRALPEGEQTGNVREVQRQCTSSTLAPATVSFRQMTALTAVLLSLFFLQSCSSSDPANGGSKEPDSSPATGTPGDSGIPRYSFSIVDTYPHDSEAFTQGLAYEDGFLYEGTGLKGRSSLRRVDLKTGRVLQRHILDNEIFGEGIALFEERIFQLTFESRIGFIYDKTDFARVGDFSYPTDGWGLTHDGAHLIMSDGTATLYLRDPQSFEEIGRIEVTESGRPLQNLNELEYVQGEVYANVFTTDLIARISPQSGKVAGWIDLRGLLPEEDQRASQVLNGIAYDPANDRLFVTGKLWPWLYQIKLVDQS